ncbi:TPA: protein YgfX [Vibrio diabolicus]
MLQWLIKLSPITSAKFVNFTASPSLTARVLNVILFLLMTWAVTLSSIPLVLSIYLLLMIVKALLSQGFVKPTSQGYWYVHCDGSVRFEALEYSECSAALESEKDQLQRVDTSTLPFKITFRLQSGCSVTIWRDSCDDQHYRQLSLVLRQWEMKQGANAPC